MRLIDVDAMLQNENEAYNKSLVKTEGTELALPNLIAHLKINKLIEETPTETVPENKPLTLEQLKRMDGEPVWIKGSDAKTSGWALIKGKREKQIANCPDDWNISYYLKDYGKTWIAYPRKMEQEATL